MAEQMYRTATLYRTSSLWSCNSDMWNITGLSKRSDEHSVASVLQLYSQEHDDVWPDESRVVPMRKCPYPLQHFTDDERGP